MISLEKRSLDICSNKSQSFRYFSIFLLLVLVLPFLVQSSSLDDQKANVPEILRRRLCYPRPTNTRVKRSPSTSYGIFIDAGSSGTRLWIYNWTTSYAPDKLPKIRGSVFMKDTPGLSDKADNTTEIRQIIHQMIEVAKGNISADQHWDTPIYVFATAGLRMLPEHKADSVTQFIYELLKDKTFNPFEFDDSANVRILSGEEEGVFAWLALNYLNDAFNKDTKADPTVGILELGGASTQIAFIPKGILLADKFTIYLASHRYSLYVHSYLDYGQEHVEKWVKNDLVEKQPNARTLQNPCMLRGDSVVVDGKTFEGTSNPTECLTILEKMVYKTEDKMCHPKPCAIGTAYQPSIPRDKIFYALGAFGKVLQNLGEVQDSGLINLNSIRKKAIEFCKKDIATLRTDYRNISTNVLKTKTCLTGLYMGVLFVNGYQFSNNTDKIFVKEKINDIEIDWTLGALLYEKFSSSTMMCSASTAGYAATLAILPSVLLVVLFHWFAVY